MIKAAKDHDADMLRSVVECGAWMDFVNDDDDLRNTALHWAVDNCQDRKDYLYEAERLGLKITEHGCDLVTKIKPATREAKLKLEEDIKEWKERHDTDLACVQALCEGHADPKTLNAKGMSALEFAKKKDPEVIKCLEDQIRQLEDLANKKLHEDV
jgi:hypothetical protein